MDKLIWILVIFATGALLPVQVGLNTRLGKIAGSPVYAALFSFIVGTVVILSYVLVTRQSAVWSDLKEAPVSVWLGGVIGALYITITILAFPKLGPGLMFGLIVAGQMTASLVLEHKNILVAEPAPINLMKVLGVLLIVAGVVIIRKN
jgi:transporter family-2 protein